MQKPVGGVAVKSGLAKRAFSPCFLGADVSTICK